MRIDRKNKESQLGLALVTDYINQRIIRTMSFDHDRFDALGLLLSTTLDYFSICLVCFCHATETSC